MRCGMVASSSSSHLFIDLCHNHVTHRQGSRLNNTNMYKGVGFFLHILYLEDRSTYGNQTSITDLTTSFGVKRSLVQEYSGLLAFFNHQGLALSARHKNGLDFWALDHQVSIAQEFRFASLVGQSRQLRTLGQIQSLMSGTSTLALLLHANLKLGVINLHAILQSSLLGQLKREPKSIIQLKGVLTRNRIDALSLARVHHFRKALLAAIERGQESRLLAFQFSTNHVMFLGTIRKSCFSSQLDCDREDLADKRTLNTELSAMSDNSANQSSANISSSHVASAHTIGHQMHDRASMVSNDLHRGLLFLGAFRVLFATKQGGDINQWLHQIGFVIVGYLLQHLAHAFQTHTGIDVLVFQRRQVALNITIVLHEH
mmetsp:Transcript_20031/g.34472  ORF Transcript_20031/g.34472 Transcript_20031/m.34472 type:complete len:372 (+) Transcript_20031:1011-2126(+)